MRQVAFGILAKLIGKNEQAVERRAQLVRHVRQEFGFVLRCQRKLLRLFFQRLSGLLDFLVLSFHFDVLVGQQLGLFFQFLVGLLQLFLLALKLRASDCDLLEQVFGTHVGFDRVEHDADRFGELIEECFVRRIEAIEGRQLHDGLDLALRTRSGSTIMLRGVASPRPEVILM